MSAQLYQAVNSTNQLIKQENRNMNSKDKLLIKVQNYKGQVVAGWRAPKNQRQAGYAVEKLLKLYTRCKQSNLLTKDLTQAIKNYADALSELAQVKAWFIAKPWLFTILNELRAIRVEHLEEEIVTEKIREHQNAICSFCKVKLRYPAFVVYRKGTQVVKISNPVGIFCLKSLHGKLNDLVTEIKATVNQNIGFLTHTREKNPSKVACATFSNTSRESNVKQLLLI